jgi:DNA-binding transcriptional LysR family regulator
MRHCITVPSRNTKDRMLRLDLDDLSLFRHIAEAGSITAGAARANLALAAASTRLRGMEAAIGAKLADRGRSGVILTPAGQTLLAHARRLLAEADRMREAMSAFAGGATGHIRMLSNTNALTAFLPDALGRFLAAHPGVTVDLQERLSDEIVGLIAEGTAELGIVAATADTAALRTFPLWTDRFVFVAPRGHALGGRERIDFSELLDLDFVGLDQASALQRFLAERAARLGARLRLRVRLRSFDAVCRMVEAGVGVGIVPETTARSAAKTLAIEVVPLADEWAVRELVLCVRAVEGLPGHTRMLVDWLRGEGDHSG